MQVPLLDLKEITAKYREELHEAVLRVTDSGWYLQGRETKIFESNYAQYIGTKHCIGVANGLQALELMFRAYKELGVLHDGDEVLVPANTYIASIMSISQNNLVPILVEPTFPSLCIDVAELEARLSSRTRAFLMVHLYGRCTFSSQIKKFCEQHGLLLFEDNAQSAGCMFEGVKTGALGNCAAHSFYPGKNLGAFGDAGAVTTDDDSVAEVVRALGNYGSTKKYVFKYIGENSRISELDAAVLDVKLRYLDEDNENRRSIASMYRKGIQSSLIVIPPVLPHEQDVYHQFPVFTEKRDELQAYLTDKGIGTLIHYPIPPHKQEAFKRWNHLSYPVTEKIHSQELSIPMSPCLRNEQIQYVVEALNSWQQ